MSSPLSRSRCSAALSCDGGEGSGCDFDGGADSSPCGATFFLRRVFFVILMRLLARASVHKAHNTYHASARCWAKWVVIASGGPFRSYCSLKKRIWVQERAGGLRGKVE